MKMKAIKIRKRIRKQNGRSTLSTFILEIKAAAICGADMKHWNNGSDEFNSIRGHEFAGEIVQVGEKVTDWKSRTESCI